MTLETLMKPAYNVQRTNKNYNTTYECMKLTKTPLWKPQRYK